MRKIIQKIERTYHEEHEGRKEGAKAHRHRAIGEEEYGKMISHRLH